MIIKIGKKPLIAAVAAFLMFSIGFNIYCYKENLKTTNKYESMINIQNKFFNTNLISFVIPVNSMINEKRNIEIFDIKKGEVIKIIPNNFQIQKIAEKYLDGITGIYVKVKAIPDGGYIIRVPFEPSVNIRNQWLNSSEIYSVNEVFILFPQEGEPYLLVLDDKKRPLFYNFEGNVNVLLKNLDTKLEPLD